LNEVSFGEWLKRRRKALDLTQEQLAQQISCSTSALCKIEAEERRPSEQIIEQLAEVFNFAPNERASFLKFVRGNKEDYLPLKPSEKRYCDRAETHARKTLGDAAFESVFAAGQKLSLDDALDLALKTVEEMKC
jgi:transcriptional regulator with XRE-family HTH domain